MTQTQTISPPLTLRDLALKAKVYPRSASPDLLRFRVILGSGLVAWAIAEWKGDEIEVDCANPVAAEAVRMFERERVGPAR